MPQISNHDQEWAWKADNACRYNLKFLYWIKAACMLARLASLHSEAQCIYMLVCKYCALAGQHHMVQMLAKVWHL